MYGAGWPHPFAGALFADLTQHLAQVVDSHRGLNAYGRVYGPAWAPGWSIERVGLVDAADSPRQSSWSIDSG